MVQQHDRDGPGPTARRVRVHVCAGGEQNENVCRLGSRETMFGIGARVEGHPGVCAGRVDVERGRVLIDAGGSETCEAWGVV